MEALADLGMSWALAREGAGRPDLTRQLAYAAVPPKVVLGLAMIGATYVLARAAGLADEVVATAVILAAAKVLDSLTYLIRSVFQAFERMEFDALAQILDGGARLILISYALLNDFGLVGLAKAILVASAIVFSASAIEAVRRFLRPVELRLDRVRTLAAAGLPLAAVWMLDSFILRIGTIVIALRVGDAAAGNFAAALRLIEPFITIPTVMATAILPLAARHLIERRDTLPWLFEASAKLAIIAGSAVTIVLVGAGPAIAGLILGPTFSVADDLVRPLALVVIPLFVHFLLVAFLVALRRQLLVVVAQLLSIAAALVVIALSADVLGAGAPAAGLIVGEVVLVVVLLGSAAELRTLSTPAVLRSLIPVLPGLVPVVAVPQIGPLASTLAGLALMGVALRFVRPLELRDARYLEDALPIPDRIGRVLLSPFH
jgi:O-antigen/teichoic acid export membrane protein